MDGLENCFAYYRLAVTWLSNDKATWPDKNSGVCCVCLCTYCLFNFSGCEMCCKCRS